MPQFYDWAMAKALRRVTDLAEPIMALTSSGSGSGSGCGGGGGGDGDGCGGGAGAEEAIARFAFDPRAYAAALRSKDSDRLSQIDGALYAPVNGFGSAEAYWAWCKVLRLYSRIPPCVWIP